MRDIVDTHLFHREQQKKAGTLSFAMPTIKDIKNSAKNYKLSVLPDSSIQGKNDLQDTDMEDDQDLRKQQEVVKA